MAYGTVQWSWFPVPVFAFLVVIDGVVLWAMAAEGQLTAGIVALTVGLTIAIMAVMLLFARQVVEVDTSGVRTWFGFGWPRRTIDRTDITAVRQVRNSGWYGWGIRWIPNGTMYNTWGLDAVELGLTNGRVFRIGTADPAGLAAAVGGVTGLAVESDVA